MDIDKWIEKVRKCECLPEDDMRKLCVLVKSHLIEESNVQPVRAPVTVCGDIHGQFHDLLALFKRGGELPHTSYVFMGDYVDRGMYSVETFTYLLLMKAKYPDQITLLRGNHETRQITQIYGFYDECQKKYGTSNVWRYCVEVFDCLNIAAIIDGKVLCVHGGLSPDINTIDQIRTLTRRQEIPHDGAFCDLVWSDPDKIDKWMRSPRGAGYLFGSVVTEHFSEINDLQTICRAHQLIMNGYQEHFNMKLYTVWSAPNYCYRCGNKASVMSFDENLEYEFKLFTDVPPPDDKQRNKRLYFV